MKDIYKYYQRRTGNAYGLSQAQYSAILDELFQELFYLMVYQAQDFSLPAGLGFIRIKKWRRKLAIGLDGKVITNNLKVDYKRTKELWEKNSEAKKNKTLVFHFNEHTSGYSYMFWWDKRKSQVKNQEYYYFRPSSKWKRYLAQALKDPDSNLDFYN